MPQMAPMLWLMLFFYFTLVFMLFMVVSYYTVSTGSYSLNTKHAFSINEFSWAW